MPDQYFEEEEFQTQFNGKLFLRILGLTRPYWKSVVGFLIAIMLVSIMDSVFAYLGKMIIDDGILAGNSSALTRISILYVSVTLAQAICVFTFIKLAGTLGERIRYDLSQQMFIHLQKLSLSYYSRTPVGWIMSRVTSDSNRVAELVTWGIMDTVWAVTNMIASMGFMLFIDWKAALIVFSGMPVLLLISIEFRKRILKEFRNVRRINSKITGSYNENITGVRVVKALCRENGNLNEFMNLTGDMYQAGFRAAWLSALFLPTVQIISAFILGGIIYYSGIQASLGAMTIGSIQAFISYVTMMIWPIQDLARVYAEIQRAIASGERIFSLIDAVPEVYDRPNALEPVSIEGDIIFDHVSFSYEDGKTVLDDFNLTVRKGETIALVGSTGGGKTTIVNLISRFYEPKKGTIYIGGVDYTSLSQRVIQSHIGSVPQTPHLFSGTIRQNIAYGRLNASNEDIKAAARLVGAHDFIMSLENGYEQEVGEGGTLLSVGQKQLLSLARPFSPNPKYSSWMRQPVRWTQLQKR